MDEKFMREAMRQAKKAAALGEMPVGAVIVRDGEIISRGYNRRETKKNALLHAEVQEVDLAGKGTEHLGKGIKKIVTDSGDFYGRTVVISTGANPRELGVEKEQQLVGRGVNYCAACDGMFYKDKVVAVIGGGNSAVADAMILSRIAKKVYIVHRRDALRATKVYHDALEKAENVEFVWDSVVSELLHEEKFTGLKIKNVKTDEESVLECDGVFVSVGRKPVTELFEGVPELDKAGYIIADESTKTNVPGVFAAGDVRTKALRQVVTAVADGAMAAHYAEEYIAESSIKE